MSLADGSFSCSPQCDKVRPQCAQCIRVGKPCPGYRDQLSLMFRDESSKVIKRAHAQWGLPAESEPGEPSRSSPTPSASSSSSASSPSSSSSPSSLSPVSAHTAHSSHGFGSPTEARPLVKVERKPPVQNLIRDIPAAVVDKGIQFYLEHYVIGLPDEPRAGQELRGVQWVHAPATRNIMAAVGLAGLANLNGDKEMDTLAQQHYGMALQKMSTSIRGRDISGLDMEVILRAVVMMAMFEVVRGNKTGAPARTHIVGGAAILTSFLPFHKSQSEGLRGLLQLCFSIVASLFSALLLASPEPLNMIPSQPGVQSDTGVLPGPFSQWVSMSINLCSPDDKPSAELIAVIVEFVKLAAYVRSRPFIDGKPETTDFIAKALVIEKQLDDWGRRQTGIWAVVEEGREDKVFPPEAVFEGCYHVYFDMYIARVWNHYRWARTMVNQLLVESVARFPFSSSSIVTPMQRELSQSNLVRLSRDTLVSIPTHYRHPRMNEIQRQVFDKVQGGAVIGIAGIPTLLFEIKVAACAPGIPLRYRTWARGIVETIWLHMGMYQAKVIADLLGKLCELEEARIQSASRVSIKTEGV
ncbi:hypothetical protein QBC38DRAFT_451807 [Podospora fimiseda]|uniref:Zn(2)-C6 fungal-type domain-containing protein n=1 Tax=Podospora fimiseda TaxID=252190 RepID=A0AAN7H355_9PEZI|nr:hypothetical protein QBC38DRAFT_451807 [Podospora fimiseda]